MPIMMLSKDWSWVLLCEASEILPKIPPKNSLRLVPTDNKAELESRWRSSLCRYVTSSNLSITIGYVSTTSL